MARSIVSRRVFLASSVLLTADALAPGRLAATLVGPWLGAPARGLSRLVLEAWGRGPLGEDGPDQFACVVTFADGHAFEQLLEPGRRIASEVLDGSHRARFALDLASPPAAALAARQSLETVRSVELVKAGGARPWRCEALGLWADDTLVLARYVDDGVLEEPGDTVRVTVEPQGTLRALALRLATANEDFAATDNDIYGNVAFADGTLLYSAANRLLTHGMARGASASFMLPIPRGLDQDPADIEEVYLRKAGSNGWLLRSVELFANGGAVPVIANRAVNQFLDNQAAVLRHRDWSSRSILTPVESPASTPLRGVTYRISGPVLGHLTDTTARIVYRVEREGTYRLKVYRYGTTTVLQQITAGLQPAATFVVTGLSPNTPYAFELFHLVSGVERRVPGSGGAVRTFPPDGASVHFRIAIGSCANNKKFPAQPAWDAITARALGPGVDPAARPDRLRFFIHLGDTMYFYDDVVGPPPETVSGMLAAHLSARKHPAFLRMAQQLPCYAVWDDHDFAGNNTDAPDLGARKVFARNAFLQYWGNPIRPDLAFGLAARFGYGNVDFYLMDGRYNRNKGAGVLFGRPQLQWVLDDIRRQGRGRLRILLSGSTWNHSRTDDHKEAYGNGTYNAEREWFYGQLATLIGNPISGLVFASGDVHCNNLYEIVLPRGGTRVAPEVVASPIANEKGDHCPGSGSEFRWGEYKRGFATLQINTTRLPWTMTVVFYRDDGVEYRRKTYTLRDGQFRY